LFFFCFFILQTIMPKGVKSVKVTIVAKDGVAKVIDDHRTSVFTGSFGGLKNWLQEHGLHDWHAGMIVNGLESGGEAKAEIKA